MWFDEIEKAIQQEQGCINRNDSFEYHINSTHEVDEADYCFLTGAGHFHHDLIIDPNGYSYGLYKKEGSYKKRP